MQRDINSDKNYIAVMIPPICDANDINIFYSWNRDFLNDLLFFDTKSARFKC